MVAHSEYQRINPAIVTSILHRMTGRYTFLPNASTLAARSGSKWTSLGAASVLCKAPCHAYSTYGL